ncbi:MAG: hypothetical protein IPK79_01355 [Vampirovibrionales bacterium]|nr:hypothetical protein [Vampirovibrionales bacterium]
MERTLISITPVNFITIGLMAIGSFLLFALVYQVVVQVTGARPIAGGGAGAPADIQIFGGGDIDPAFG